MQTKKDNLWALDVCRRPNTLNTLKRQKVQKQHKLPFVIFLKGINLLSQSAFKK